MAARCFCGCGESVPRRLRIVTDLGQAIRQRRRDLQSLLDAGMTTPQGPQLLRVVLASENVLARSIHRNQPVSPEIGAGTSDVLVAYELLFGPEALGRAMDPYPDEILRGQLGLDLDDLEGVFGEGTQPAGGGVTRLPGPSASHRQAAGAGRHRAGAAPRGPVAG
jgi:hypothetical protein